MKMSKKSTRKPRHLARTVAKPKPHGFYALIRLDISSVKKVLLLKWKKAERDFEKQQKEWDEYCNEDRPAYEKWLHATFGSRMTELRELHEQIRRKSWFIEQVECLSSMSGTSARKLYQELKEKATDGKSLHDVLADYIRELDDLDDDEDEIFDDEDCEFADNNFDQGESRSFFEKLFGENLNDEDDGDLKEEYNKIFEEFEKFFGNKTVRGPSQPDIKNKQARIRDIYRKLCFKLHPDTGCDFNAENSRLWHQIQDAYQKNDLDRLLAIQASVDMKQDPMASHISCTQILAVIDDFKTGLRSVRTLVSKAQKESSWRFLSWTDRQRCTAAGKIEQQLTREHISLKYEIEYLEDLEQRWSRPIPVRKTQPREATPRPKAKVKPKEKPKEKAKPDPASSWQQAAQQMVFDF